MILTEDLLLGGRVRLRQPAEGYRAAIDPVLLAAAVPARDGDNVLEPGSGAGAASLCLLARVPCRIIGLEKESAVAALATENAALNGFADRMSVLVGDVAAPPRTLAQGGADHVMANPPYLEPGGTASPDPLKEQAHVEGTAALDAWVRFALRMLRPKGTLTFIHRADRIEGLMAALAGKAGEIAIFPLWPKAGSTAKRVIVRARKDVRSPTRLAPGLVLHAADGQYTEAADAILRGGAPLEI